MEANQVAVEDSEQDFISNWKDSVDLARGKRRVEEEADLDIGPAGAYLLPKHLWQKHQVVVVDPNEITILDLLRNGLGKEAVGFGVGLPRFFVEGDFAWMVMEQWPENRICGRSGHRRGSIQDEERT